MTEGRTGPSQHHAGSPRQDDPDYVMGRSDAETLRLQKQAALYDPTTRQMFEQAGIGPGMKVLDIGSGAGDVAMLAAAVVGPSGAVVGVDSNPAILATARKRAGDAGVNHVEFIAGDIRDIALADDFDAVVGRVVLMYLKDPADTLRMLAGRLRPGGIVAFQELDWSTGPMSIPPSRTLAQTWSWIPELFRRSGLNPQMGLALRQVFRTAGLPEPQMHLDAPVGGGADFAGYDYIESGVRSSVDRIVALGLATADEIDIDNLARRLRDECGDGVLMLPSFVCAWTRKA